MRKHSTFLLVVSLLLVFLTLEMTSPPLTLAAPPSLHAHGNHADHPDSSIVCLIVFIIIAVVVGIIIWGLIQMCKKIPPPPPPNNGQPTNVTVALPLHPIDTNTYLKFAFDFEQLASATNSTSGPCYFGGNTNGIADEAGNVYNVFCDYQLLSATNPAGPWNPAAYVTNWLGGTFSYISTNSSGQCATFLVTNQETALYDLSGNLASAQRWSLTQTDFTNCIQPRLIMPQSGPTNRFYRLVLLSQ